MNDDEIAAVGQALAHPRRVQMVRHLAGVGPITSSGFRSKYELTTSVAAVRHHFVELERLGVTELHTVIPPRGHELHLHELGGPHADAVARALQMLEGEPVQAVAKPGKKSRRAEETGQRPLPAERAGDGEWGSRQIDWRKVIAPRMSRLEIALLELPEGTDLNQAAADRTLMDLLPRSADLDLGALDGRVRSFSKRKLDRYVGRRPIDWSAIARIVLTPRRIGVLEVLALDGGRSLTTPEICVELQEPRSHPISTEIRRLRDEGWVEVVPWGSVVSRAERGYLYRPHPAALVARGPGPVGEEGAEAVDRGLVTYR